MSSSRFFKRTYELTITDEASGWSKTFTDLDIRFNIKRYKTQTAFKAEIGVLGLSHEDINRISVTATSMWYEALRMRKTITLSAGYDGNNSLIFKGFIVNAVPTSPPEMWLNMTAVNYTDIGGPVYQITMAKGSTLADIANYVAYRLDMPINADMFTQGNVRTNGMTVIGGKTEVLSALKKVYRNWNVYEDLGILVVTDQPLDASKGGNVEFSLKSGLLSLSNVTFYGVDVTTFLQDVPMFTNSFSVKSEMIPSANGTYKLIGKEFVGHYRGREWFSKFIGKLKESI